MLLSTSGFARYFFCRDSVLRKIFVLLVLLIIVLVDASISFSGAVAPRRLGPGTNITQYVY